MGTIDDFYAGRRAAADYEFGEGSLESHNYLLPALLTLLPPPGGPRLVDLGSGNGTLTAKIAEAGYDVVGVENSESGLAHAREAFPTLTFEKHDLSEELPDGMRHRFDVALSVEVIEHLFLPRGLFGRADEALRDGGLLIVTTPFHGYWKNLALAATNSMDHHWRPGWDFGHIKFFSRKTLQELAAECGYRPVAWRFVGRVPRLAKSMVMVARKETRRRGLGNP